jgi:hypothetical protein
MFKRKALLVLAALTFLNYFLYSTETLNIVNYLSQLKLPSESNKTILFYNGYFHNKKWGSNVDTYTINEPRSDDCPYVNCIFTHDRKYLADILEYDGVIFHREFHPQAPELSKRNPQQLFIMATRE